MASIPSLRTVASLLAAGWLLTASAVAVGGAAASQRALAAAIGLHERGDFEGARRAFEALSRQGLPVADFNLAVMHLHGELPGGATEALRLMTRAADAGFVTAMFGIGQLYEQGRLGAPDPVRAFAWHLRASLAGSVDAQVEAATAYYLGRGVGQDLAEAARWYREAAKGGDIGAQYLIASMYEHGQGVARDPRLARHWYAAAAAQGDVAAAAKVEAIDRLAGAGDD